jgi:hypothetical protein
LLVRVVPGQHRHRWCRRCHSWSALDVGVYGGADPPALIGTFTACPQCDPDVFGRPDQPEEVGGG